MFKRKSVALTVGWVIAMLAAVVLGQAASASSDGLKGIACSADDLVYTVIMDFPEMIAGTNTQGARTPDAALGSYLAKTYPRVRNDFTEVAADDHEVIYQKARGTTAVAEILVQDVAGGYEVARLTACNSLLVEGDQ